MTKVQNRRPLPTFQLHWGHRNCIFNTQGSLDKISIIIWDISWCLFFFYLAQYLTIKSKWHYFPQNNVLFLKTKSCWYLNWRPQAESLHVSCVWMKSRILPESLLQAQVYCPRAQLFLHLLFDCSVLNMSPCRKVYRLDVVRGFVTHPTLRATLYRLCKWSWVCVCLLPKAHGYVTVSSSIEMWTN